MHGLINRAIERFIRDTYGRDTWGRVTRLAGLDFTEFESMLTYETALTHDVLAAAETALDRPLPGILEDIGTYLVSHRKVEGLRRLLRFGGEDFHEFLHSLDDLPARARLAVCDLEIPEMELQEHGAELYTITCRGNLPGFGHVVVGLLRALADDYGALVMLEHQGGCDGPESVEIRLLAMGHATGRAFDLGARTG